MDGWFRCVSCWGHRLLSGAQPVQLPGFWNPLGCQVMFAWISFNATFPRENTVDEANEWYSRWQTFKEIREVIRGSRCRCDGTKCFYVTWSWPHHWQSELTSSLNNIIWNIFLMLDESLANHLRWNQFTDDKKLSSIITSQLVLTKRPAHDIQVSRSKLMQKKQHFPKPPRKRALGHLRIFWEDSLSKNSVHSVVGPSFLRWQVLTPLFHGCSSIYHSSSALVGRSTGFDHRWAPSNYNLHTPNETSCRCNVKSIQQSLFDSHFTWIFAQNTQP